MMYGSLVFTPAGDGTVVVNRYTIGKTQLALFTVVPEDDLKSCNVLAQRYRFLRLISLMWATMAVRSTPPTSVSLRVRPVFAIG